MADGYHRLPGQLNAFSSSSNRSQTALALPTSTPQRKRASSFYPARGPGIVDDSNPDPFYLEHTLTSGAPWGTCRLDSRDVRCIEESNPYSMLSSVSPGKEVPFTLTARGDTARLHSNNNRSTLSVVELEHQLGLQQVAGARPWEGSSVNYDQGSFSSVQTEATPDLTPSSSFSSNYSAPIYPDGVLLEPLPVHVQLPPSPRNQVYPCASTPLNHSQTTLATRPSTPVRQAKTPIEAPNASSDTLVMQPVDSHDPPSHRGKPLPSLPTGARSVRSGSAHSSRKGPPPAIRPPIAASMISPPCLINPVTMEPHTSHFDRAMFIPANDCQSPVPSPGPASPSIERQPTANSSRTRPSTSTSEAFPEQSVWESDSDSESLDPKSLSRKPMDTLKKVRSRVHLRVAKSAPKLQNQQNSCQQAHPLEKFPSMPDKPPEDLCPSPTRNTIQSRSRDMFRPPGLPSLRLVNPSLTSLGQVRSRRNSGQSRNIDIDRTTAAAMQAKSRRRPRSDSKKSLPAEREKMCTLCREERSDKAILTLARPPLYKRVWESLRVLGCHGEITPPRPRRPM
ncbi:hypothetical protein BO70DRAFT_20247 [Aspergillus heteromorphus CBS 117.55]|uniref:Uncharacterized protein n=1 Tax=Aspergillus heteromorphus CBS 117.55 TaxID=1448321 RepID=A0A317X5E5_9EURO|nr:uncharacterized protein BO70DRAFT_20247 [Aspergillus heteromorphus CBS 117.55]PWY92842.1 hypothetical protein BO70DRAFT_20247 [Aspergillus heteromorphus CBS 117.55]